jgi:hypothetical protein
MQALVIASPAWKTSRSLNGPCPHRAHQVRPPGCRGSAAAYTSQIPTPDKRAKPTAAPIGTLVPPNAAASHGLTSAALNIKHLWHQDQAACSAATPAAHLPGHPPGVRYDPPAANSSSSSSSHSSSHAFRCRRLPRNPLRKRLDVQPVNRQQAVHAT